MAEVSDGSTGFSQPGVDLRGDADPVMQPSIPHLLPLAKRPTRSLAGPSTAISIAVWNYGRTRPAMGHRVVRGVEHQVLVDVDEAWQQRDVAEINDIAGIRP